MPVDYRLEVEVKAKLIPLRTSSPAIKEVVTEVITKTAVAQLQLGGKAALESRTQAGADVAAWLKNANAGKTPLPGATEATLITDTTATLNGGVEPYAESTTVEFVWGIVGAAPTTSAAAESPVAGAAGPTAVTFAATPLTADTLYEYRVKATSTDGVLTTTPVQFRTLPTP